MHDEPAGAEMTGESTVIQTPGVADVRGRVGDELRARSTPRGVALFAVAATCYAASLVGIALLGLGWKMPLALANGFFVCVLFVIGHDACHGSLTPRPRLNKVIGRLAFLPSLHPYAAWEHTHNGLHHAYTNVRGKDPVYAPLSVDAYQTLAPWRRGVERIYRTPFGLGLQYLIEIWWKHELFPPTARQPKKRRRQTFLLDRATVVTFAIVEIVALTLAADASSSGIAATLLLGIVAPFAIFIWADGTLTFQHHTHPAVPWYADTNDSSFYAGQVQSVVHVELPRLVELMLHNIMDHTAHHVDTRVPLYHLGKAQDQLEAAYGGDIVSVPWSLGGLLDTLRVCRLYDYAEHRWLDFDGTPTSARLLAAPVTIEGGA